MNKNTKDSLQEFVEAIQKFAGEIQNPGDVKSEAFVLLYDAAEDLKSRLDKDETII